MLQVFLCTEMVLILRLMLLY